jgi:hypothetical protein
VKASTRAPTEGNADPEADGPAGVARGVAEGSGSDIGGNGSEAAADPGLDRRLPPPASGSARALRDRAEP